jgi:heterogeneous nuclear ribonucleoprotein L
MELDIERKRTAASEMDDAGEKRRKVDADIDLHHCPPSRVIHVRAVPDGSTQYDMMAAVQQFGKVSYVTLMPKVRQALIEMETVEAAMAVVDHNKTNTVVVKGRPVFFNFSKSQTIKRFSEPGPSLEGQQPNHVLLFTIFNPLFPITTEVIHKICSPHGVVVRIVIFHKNGVQAMVEFPTVEDAARVKEKLDGADIYAGCCTLKIEYSKSQTLNVRTNSEETWDINLVGQEMYQPSGD